MTHFAKLWLSIQTFPLKFAYISPAVFFCFDVSREEHFEKLCWEPQLIVAVEVAVTENESQSFLDQLFPYEKKSFHTCALLTLFHKLTFCPKYWRSSSPKNLFWIEIKQLTLILKRQTNSCKYPPKSRNYRNWIFFNTLWTLCQLLNSVFASTKLLESLSIYIEKIWICIFLSCWSFRKNPPKNA